jgi:hypothetical protein
MLHPAGVGKSLVVQRVLIGEIVDLHGQALLQLGEHQLGVVFQLFARIGQFALQFAQERLLQTDRLAQLAERPLTLLFDEYLVPVCAPLLSDGAQPPQTLAALLANMR